jgi:acetylornithine/LysW-gamma-L-lysine aminotransferase
VTISTLTEVLEETYSSGVYIKRDVQIVRGEGARLFDTNGTGYIDCVSGHGATNLGHAHPAVLRAITEQSHTLIACPELFQTPMRAEYQAALCRAAGMPRVFLCNSGTEAVEGALKFARLSTGRTGIIAAMRGFHGRTMGALSATWNSAYRDPFMPLVPDFSHVPFNNVERLAEALNANTAAVLLEVVQGEGGVNPAEPNYLAEVQALCRENGTLLILDEIQSGFGRTGSLFAFQGEGIQPDLVCVAKSIAGGLPMGAVLIGERVRALPAGSHGSSFGGNPLACAAALAVLDTLLSTDLIEQASKRGEALMRRLHESLPSSTVREVRGRGFMIGIELRGKVAPVIKALQSRGVVALTAGPTVLRLLPPLVISDEDLWQVASVVEEVLADAV